MAQPPTIPLPPYASEIVLRLASPGCPEDRLMLAVLLDAVALLRERATGVYPHPMRLVASTVRWFKASDDSWPLSFVNVCRALSLDAATVRAGLERELSDLGGRSLLEPVPTKVVALTPRLVEPLAGVSTGKRRTRG
jgi:hypothetical protein